MSTGTKQGESAAEEPAEEPERKDVAETADKANERLGEAAGDAKKAKHGFIHDDKKFAKDQPYRNSCVPDSKADK
jgi:hypothetical protein